MAAACAAETADGQRSAVLIDVPIDFAADGGGWRAGQRSLGENSSMHRAISTTAAMLAVAFVLLAAAPAFAGYGAVAYDTATGRRGVSWNQATAQKAAETALSQCGASGCKVLMRVGPLRCGALATTADGKGWGAASRPSSDAARLAALANCGKAKLGECIVRTTDCNK